MLSASARFWVEELAEMFRMASRRLEDLHATGGTSSSAMAAQTRQPVVH